MKGHTAIVLVYISITLYNSFISVKIDSGEWSESGYGQMGSFECSAVITSHFTIRQQKINHWQRTTVSL